MNGSPPTPQRQNLPQPCGKWKCVCVCVREREKEREKGEGGSPPNRLCHVLKVSSSSTSGYYTTIIPGGVEKKEAVGLEATSSLSFPQQNSRILLPSIHYQFPSSSSSSSTLAVSSPGASQLKRKKRRMQGKRGRKREREREREVERSRREVGILPRNGVGTHHASGTGASPKSAALAPRTIKIQARYGYGGRKKFISEGARCK